MGVAGLCVRVFCIIGALRCIIGAPSEVQRDRISGCDERALPRWSVESARTDWHNGVMWQPPVSEAWPPHCPEGKMPPVIRSFSLPDTTTDCEAVDRFFWGVRHGTFIEIGGHDGLRMSNTKMLEDALGWRGLIVEPDHKSYLMAVGNRPRTHVIKAACGPNWVKEGVELESYGGIAVTTRVRQHNRTTAPNITWFAPNNTATALVTMAALSERFAC
eukprot:Hpha_TRINITY_DN19469_c0_g1::TRINITY_DN19469_c0_g1_i1::g.45723::m.45723